MVEEIISIEVYDKAERITTTMEVIRLSENIFRATENEIFNEVLTVGTEFETHINEAGKHEVVRIIKASNYTTYRFLLPAHSNISDHQNLGEEIMKQGGFWQVDFGGIVTINLPKDCKLDINEIRKALGVE